MTRIKDSSFAAGADAELPWLQRYIPLTRRVAADLSRTTLRGRRIALMDPAGPAPRGDQGLCLTLARRRLIMGTLPGPRCKRP